MFRGKILSKRLKSGVENTNNNVENRLCSFYLQFVNNGKMQ